MVRTVLDTGVLAAEALCRSVRDGAVRATVALAANAPAQCLLGRLDRSSPPDSSDVDR